MKNSSRQHTSVEGLFVFFDLETLRNMESAAGIRHSMSSKSHDVKEISERLRLALKAGNLGTFSWNLTKGDGWWSEETSKIMGLSEEPRYLDTNFFLSVIHPEDLPRVEREFLESIKIGPDLKIAYRIGRPNGEIRHILEQAQIIRDEAGNPVQLFGTVQDVTEFRVLEENLRRAKDEAERANSLKSEFLANMSHEIRTPLGAMIGFAELLRDPSLTYRERDHYIDILTRNGEQLSVIINDILDLSKIEAGHMTLDFVKTNPVKIVEDIVSLMRIKAQQKGLALNFENDIHASQQIVTDSTRFRQVLVNLIGNSIKFTEKGGVSISMRGCPHATGLTVSVKDTGIGIEPSQRDRIFDKFVQADGSMRRRFGGTGLGLALSRVLARAMGGDVVLADSKPGEGSTFVVTIGNLLDRVQHSTKDPGFTRRFDDHGEEVSSEKPLDGVRVLVVDDAEDNRQLVRGYLAREGAEVFEADNGLDGHDKALRGDYDIVLMDIQMPEMDGYAATHKLREDGYQKPIIALSAHAMTEVRRKCLEAGYTEYIAKPIRSRELVHMIASHVFH